MGGAYVIERELGGGGMSRVFLAREVSLDRQVVIKSLLDDEDWSTGSVERFCREILTAARLQHPHIVPVLAAGDAAGVPYSVMPWVEGASLRERLERGPLPLADAIAMLRDVARALAAAHASAIAYRSSKAFQASGRQPCAWCSIGGAERQDRSMRTSTMRVRSRWRPTPVQDALKPMLLPMSAMFALADGLTGGPPRIDYADALLARAARARLPAESMLGTITKEIAWNTGRHPHGCAAPRDSRSN